MVNDRTKDMIFRLALQNAVMHDGKANPGALIGKVISADPSFRARVLELREVIGKTVSDVNAMSLEEQKAKLSELAPELLEKKKRKKDEGLPELKGAKEGKVVTRFAPSPTGPLTLGQFLRAVMLSYGYAQKYKGKFILRIEDTDASKIERKFIEWIKEDLKKCDVHYDQCVHQSERIELYYDFAEKMIKEGKAYVCTCSAESFRELKREMKDCPCRKNSPEENMEKWEKMKNGGYEEGEAVLRLKTSMQDKNPVMRDPPIFRINKKEHPLAGKKYSVWPLYNFSCAIDDHTLGITHVFRGKEHEHNTAVQNVIYDFFGWEKPVVINFGMIRFPGMVQHTREMKELIAKGEISGWDDPRLPTIRALLRRGFVSDALKVFAFQCGLTKNDIQSSWKNLEAVNKKFIDPIAKRFMIVLNPEKITIKGKEGIAEIKEPFHPDNPDMGDKLMILEMKSVYVCGDDFEKYKGKVVRLKGAFNVTLERNAEIAGDEIVREMPKIQWVSEPHIDVKVLMKDGSALSGIGEIAMENLTIGEIIQMERVGFGRVDGKENETVTIAFGHK
ncbi:MAG: glutamate--tRNA ligase [Candidatus Micrarchaeota archaeon]|nr:glutamate--tRNA ligase [Candidatus Micrarchaeota archaeon]